MLRSMYSAISGLKNHQTMLDVVGANIANVNTVGYKAERTSFKELISQTVRGASGATAARGGTNPLQVGLGAGIASIDQLMTQGNLQTTSVVTDVAIQGDGFFQVQDQAGTEIYFTRAGNFSLDEQGGTSYLVTADGYYVWGRTDGGNGIVEPADPLGRIGIPTTAKSVAIDQTGLVSYIDGTSGAVVQAGRIQVAKFGNPAGLERAGNSLLRASNNSGAAVLGDPTTGGRGQLVSGALEMSNVDLAQEFTNMISAQRGFQANSRIISASDELLQDLVNLKR